MLFINKLKLIKYFIIFLLLCSCVKSPNTVLSPLKWESDVNFAINKANLSNKLVLLYFYGSGCEWCEAINTSINDKNVRNLLNDKFILLWVDVESDLAKGSGIKFVPTIVIIKPNKNGGDPVGSNVGYLDSESFKQFILKNVERSYSL